MTDLQTDTNELVGELKRVMMDHDPSVKELKRIAKI